MCLYASKERTKEFRDAAAKEIICWKVVICDEDGLHSKVRKGYKWKAGWNKRGILSAFRSKMSWLGCTFFDVLYGMRVGSHDYSHGVHVYTIDPNKNGQQFYLYKACRIIQVTCRKKDLIAADNYTMAMFKKVHLSKEEYEKCVS